MTLSIAQYSCLCSCRLLEYPSTALPLQIPLFPSSLPLPFFPSFSQLSPPPLHCRRSAAALTCPPTSTIASASLDLASPSHLGYGPSPLSNHMHMLTPLLALPLAAMPDVPAMAGPFSLTLDYGDGTLTIGLAVHFSALAVCIDMGITLAPAIGPPKITFRLGPAAHWGHRVQPNLALGRQWGCGFNGLNGFLVKRKCYLISIHSNNTPLYLIHFNSSSILNTLTLNPE